MKDFIVKKLAEKEVNDLFEGLPTSNEFRQGFFGNAFQNEKDSGYTALPANERSYYLVSTSNRDEALFGINCNYPNQICISSFARVIAKDNKVASGWQYLQAMIEQVLILMCKEQNVKTVYAKLTSEGGIKAFCELKSKSCLPNECSIKWGVDGAVYVELSKAKTL